MQTTVLCHVNDIPDPGAREFQLKMADKLKSVFIIHFDQKISAFINSCPHTGVALNWLPDQFLDFDNEFIQCSLHGARFRPDDGYCVWGPCAGQALTPLSITLENDRVMVEYE